MAPPKSTNAKAGGNAAAKVGDGEQVVLSCVSTVFRRNVLILTAAITFAAMTASDKEMKERYNGWGHLDAMPHWHTGASLGAWVQGVGDDGRARLVLMTAVVDNLFILALYTTLAGHLLRAAMGARGAAREQFRTAASYLVVPAAIDVAEGTLMLHVLREPVRVAGSDSWAMLLSVVTAVKFATVGVAVCRFVYLMWIAPRSGPPSKAE